MTEQLRRFDASFVGLTILDISGRPVRGIPEGGNVEFIDEIRLNPAGTAAGALMNGAKLGLKCRAVACVGQDEKGDFITDYYGRLSDKSEGIICCEHMQRVSEKQTSATILPIRPNGERPALHQRGASDKLFIKEADFPAVCDAKVLHHGGTGLLEDMDLSGQSAKLLAYAKEKGVITTLDLIAPNDKTLDLLKPLLPNVDYFMPSMEEALQISKQETPEEACKFFMDLGARACILKWGANGSFVKTADDEFRMPAFRVDVKDTTGCGDAYCGGFVAGICKGMNVKEACQLGTATSGLVATGLGSDAGVVNYEATQRFVETAEILP